MVIEDSKEYTWLQCQTCGELYRIDRKISVEKLYVASICPRCGGRKGLNCGQSKECVYKFMNINIDPHYY